MNAGTLGIAVLLLLTLPSVFAPPARQQRESGAARAGLSSVRQRARRRAALTRRIGPWGSLLIAGLVLAVTQAGMGLTSSVIVAAILQVFSSAAFALFNMTALTMRQRQVPDALLGRVSGVYFTVTQGAEALGAIAGGAIAAVAGIRAPMLAGAGPIAAVTIFIGWRHRSQHGASQHGASQHGAADRTA